MRVVAAVGRNVAMTQPFDPDIPPPTAREAAARVLGLLAAEPLRPQALLDALDVLPLQRDFYAEIRRWLRRVRRDGKAFGPGVADEDRHEVLLRHLIRVLFVWIMKEEGSVPRRLFERSFPLEHGIEDYHGGVLRFLFHRRLNTLERDRAPHPRPGADMNSWVSFLPNLVALCGFHSYVFVFILKLVLCIYTQARYDNNQH